MVNDGFRRLAAVDANGQPDPAPLVTGASRPERRRLTALRRTRILDSSLERDFNDVAALTAQLLNTPMAAVRFVDETRVWAKATVGFAGGDTPRVGSFCDAVVRSDQPLVVHDARNDARFAGDRLVLGETHVAFYAGVAIRVGGERIGTLCALDVRPRRLDARRLDALRAMGRGVERLLELRWRRSMASIPNQRNIAGLARRVRSIADFDSLLGSESHPAWLYDIESLQFLAVNDAAVEKYGWSRPEFLAMGVDAVGHRADPDATRASAASGGYRYATGRSWVHQRADGSVFTVQVVGATAALEGAKARLAVVADLSQRLHGQAELIHAATRDQLTGLPNRMTFFDTLAATLKHTPNRSVTVLYLDLDGFKVVNDTSGHTAGDALLAATGARLASTVRDGDTAARLGGDEFAILCPDMSEVDARRLADRLVHLIEQPITVQDREFHLTASVGVAVAANASAAEHLVANADIAMLAAKGRGRGTVGVFDEHLRTAIANRVAIESDLRRAIRDDEFVVYYQPIVEIDGPRVHFEALVRWRHPDLGILAPGRFIDVASDAGLLGAIGSIVLREVAAATVRLRNAGFRTRIAYNLPAHDLNEAFVTEFQHVVAATGMDPAQLIVEVTESAFAENSSAEATSRRLQAMGVAISIDDFGTGYSSLERLRSLDVDALKLDQSFIAQIHTTQGRGMASAVVQLAQAMGIPVVAEGVETAEQYAAAREIGCAYVQGYLIARPAPEADAVALLVDGVLGLVG